MKNYKFALIVLLISVTTFFNSCREENLIETKTVEDIFFVNEELASLISVNLSFSNDKTFLKSAVDSKKKIKSITPAPGKNEKTVFYIINYENGGFVILTADKRISPIAAFSLNGEFSVDAEGYNGGLVSWLRSLKENVDQVREKDQSAKEDTQREWNNVISPMVIEPPGGCEEYSILVGPLLNTMWAQGCGYNEFLPFKSCAACYHVYAGCTTVAMAQVMRFHEYPSTFPWSSMANTYGNDEVAHLMESLYGNLNPDPECDGTKIGLDIIDDVFKNNYGYSTANIAAYNYNTVKSNLSLLKPVILGGGEDVGWWIFHSFANGHMWVCDGYNEWAQCLYDEYGNYTGRVEYLYFHMNWGFNGNGDGWFGFDGWQPTINGVQIDVSYDKKMIYNITP